MSEKLDSQIKIFSDVLDSFESAGVLPHVIVVGSWAEFVYDKAKLLDFKANLRTQDIDILIPNIRRPQTKVNIADVLKSSGFELRRNLEGLMKFNKNGEIDIEFLVREIGRGQLDPYQVPSLGVTAQGLRNMEVLTDHAIPVPYEKYLINVPRPEAYVIHKMIINPERLPEYKREKDIEAIRNIIEKADSKEFKENLINIYLGLTKTQQKKVLKTCQDYNLKIGKTFIECVQVR